MAGRLYPAWTFGKTLVAESATRTGAVDDVDGAQPCQLLGHVFGGAATSSPRLASCWIALPLTWPHGYFASLRRAELGVFGCPATADATASCGSAERASRVSPEQEFFVAPRFRTHQSSSDANTRTISVDIVRLFVAQNRISGSAIKVIQTRVSASSHAARLRYAGLSLATPKHAADHGTRRLPGLSDVGPPSAASRLARRTQGPLGAGTCGTAGEAGCRISVV